MADFTPPPLSAHEGPAPFVPPPLSAHEGPANSQPGWLERGWKATGLPDNARSLFQDFGADNPDPGIVVHNAMKLLGTSLNESGKHTTYAMRDASMGNFGSAAGNAIASVPFVGPMIDKLATHIENGEIPEAAGTALMLFGPKLLSKAPAAANAVASAAGKTVDAVKAGAGDLGAGVKAFAAKPSVGQGVPGTAGISPEIMEVLALHPKVAMFGSVLKRLENASNAMSDAKGARLPAEQPPGGWGFSNLAGPADSGVQLNPLQQRIADAYVKARQARDNPQPQPASAPAAEAPPTPQAPIKMNMAQMSPGELQQAVQFLRARRGTAVGPQMAPEQVQQGGALLDALQQQAPAQGPPSPDLSSNVNDLLWRSRKLQPPEPVVPPVKPAYTDPWQATLEMLKAKQAAQPVSFGLLDPQSVVSMATNNARAAAEQVTRPISPLERLKQLADAAAAARANAGPPQISSFPLGARGSQ